MSGSNATLGPQVPGTTTLVFGSYPPLPTLSARVTQAEVVRAWAAGETVTVVSPRSTAAHLAVRIAGPLSGHRLDTVRRNTGATRLVFCAEAHVPVPLDGPAPLRWVRQLATVRELARAFAAFEHVTVVTIGDLGVPARIRSALLAGAHEVRAGVAPDGPAAPASGPEARVVHARAVADRLAATARPASSLGPVNALGPIEIRWQDLLRRGLRIVAQRVLGRHAPAVRRRVAVGVRAARRARRAVRRVPSGPSG